MPTQELLPCEVVRRTSTVDVVVPCYNYARYLRPCVESVLSQPDVSVRVLVIDDSSSDETPQVGQSLAAADHRVEFVRHAANRGHIATYNEGLLDWSTADYVVLLSADDMLAPGALSRAVSIMDRDPSIGMVYGPAVHFSREEQLPTVVHSEPRYTRFSGSEWLEARCRAGHNVISSPEVVVRGSIQRAIGGYRPELPHAGDLEMWLRVAAVSSIGYIRRIPQAFYRVHPKSMLRTRYHTSLTDLRQRKAVFDAFFAHHGGLAHAAQLHELANRALAREALWEASRAYDRDEVQQVGAAALIAFAVTAYRGATSLPEHRALRRRQHLGAWFCNRTQLFAPAAAVRRLRSWVAQRRWQRRGI
jgi:glycosyltransferase involved in cell wall biosynthesis